MDLYRTLTRALILATLGLALLASSAAWPGQSAPIVHAAAPLAGIVGNGTPASCTEAALDLALAGGGTVTFDCGPAPLTLVLSSSKAIAQPTVVDGGGLITLSGQNQRRLFYVLSGSSLTVRNLTLADGQALNDSGGAIYNLGRLTVAHTTLQGNSASYHGGAILNFGTLDLSDSVLSGNQSGVNGAGIDSTQTLTVTDTLFENNTAGVRGGAINNYLGHFAVLRSRFLTNSSGGYGGAVVNDAGTGSIRGSGFYSNTASSVGGGLRNNGDLDLADSTFAGNQGSEGGAIANAGRLNVLNSTLSANRAGVEGAGINNEATGTLDLHFATLWGNRNAITGASAGNLSNLGSAVAGASVLAAGYPDNCAKGSHVPITSVGDNLESLADCGFTAGGDLQGVDPLLGSLQNNGGPTLTQAPIAGSPAIDRVPGSCVPADQRGLVRPQGSQCDAGALEVAAAVPPVGSGAMKLPWPMWGREAQHSGRSAAAGPDDSVVLGAPWPFHAFGGINTAVAIDYAGYAYFGTKKGALHAVSPNGGEQFRFPAGGSIGSSPALVTTGPGPTPGEDWAPPLTSRVYFGADDGQIYALSAPDGKLEWQMAPGVPANSAPLRSPVTAAKRPGSALNRAYVGAENGALYAVFETGPNSAATAWQVQTGAALTTAPALSLAPAAGPHYVYVGGGDGKLYCLDALNGQFVSYTLGGPGPIDLAAGPLTSPLVTSDGIIVAGSMGRLFGYDALCRVENPYWHRQLPAAIKAAPAQAAGGQVVVIAGDGLYGFSRFGDPLWSQSFGHPLAAQPPAADASGAVYVAATDGWLFAVDAATGSVRWGLQVQGSGPSDAVPLAIDGRGRIYQPDGGSVLNVIADRPAYQLAFHSDQNEPGNLDIYALRETYGVVDPGRTQRLTRGPDPERQPAYGLDAGRMTFVRDTAAAAADVLLANAVAAAQADLTGLAPGLPFTAGSHETDPIFSPVDDRNGASRLANGRRYLAFTTDVSGVSRLAFLNLTAYENGGRQFLTLSDWAQAMGTPFTAADLEPPNTEQSQIAFSPDGTYIAWRTCDFELNQSFVKVLRPAGASSTLQTLGLPVPIEGACADFWPAFAPDSRWLAMREGTGIAVYDPARGARVTLAAGPKGRLVTHLNWAPDGSEIAIGGRLGGASDLFALSGPGYGTGQALTGSSTADEPFYHFLKLPPPQIQGTNPAQVGPGDLVQIRGRGFEILHPLDNHVFFTDTLHGAWLPAEVTAAGVDPAAGLGVLTVRVPPMAGNGRIRVITRYGEALSAAVLYLLPRPASIRQPASVPGAKVRVFGLGFDLTDPMQYSVLFPDGLGGFISRQVSAGGLEGNQEYLVAEVPDGIAETGAPRVQYVHGSGDCACQFARLHPTLAVTRVSGLPSEATQGCSELPVTLVARDFPYDPFWGYGVTHLNLTVEMPGRGGPEVVVPWGQAGFTDRGQYTATVTIPSRPFTLLAGVPGGMTTVTAVDDALAASHAAAPFRTPLQDIPIIFVPGTSGNSLDVVGNPQVPPAVVAPAVPFDLHSNQPQCLLCPPLVHVSKPYVYAGLDPFGPRVWVGSEFLAYAAAEYLAEITSLQIPTNNVNHYLDVLKFNAQGQNALSPNQSIQPGTVFNQVAIPSGNATILADVYRKFIEYMTNAPNQYIRRLNRPLCDGATGLCRDPNGNVVQGGGATGLYLFPYDFRGSLETESARLAAYVDTVLGRTDVQALGITKVVLITHSYGGPIARTYYMEGNHAQKVDQVISMGGGFMGAPKVDKILEMGDNWGHGIRLGGSLSLGFADWEIQELAQNWPTSYFQGPNSEEWFWDDSAAFNRSYIRDLRPGAPQEIHSYAASADWLEQQHNGTVEQAARLYFAPRPWLGDFRYGTGGVYHQRLVSKGLSTDQGTTIWRDLSAVCQGALAAAAQYSTQALAAVYQAAVMAGPECWGEVTWRAPIKGDGDNTILYHSALGRLAAGDDHVFVIDGVDHSLMPNDLDLLDLTGSLVRGRVCSQTQVASSFQSKAAPELPASVFPTSAAGLAAPSIVADRWWLGLTGPARLDIYDDQGRHVGPSPDLPTTVYDMAIPGVTYDPGTNSSSAVLPQAGTYTITLHGRTLAGVNLRLTGYSATAQGATTLYANIPVTGTSEARLVFNSQNPVMAPLRLDFAGDGSFIEVPPTVLDPAVASDTVPPTTTLVLHGRQVTLTAVDNPGGSGVVQTFYLLDTEPSFKIYSAPFVLPVGVHRVMAFSVDRNGNREHPGAELRLGAVYLPLLKR